MYKKWKSMWHCSVARFGLASVSVGVVAVTVAHSSQNQLRHLEAKTPTSFNYCQNQSQLTEILTQREETHFQIVSLGWPLQMSMLKSASKSQKSIFHITPKHFKIFILQFWSKLEPSDLHNSHLPTCKPNYKQQLLNSTTNPNAWLIFIEKYA